jgi:Class III cytochrome C family
MRAAAGPRAGWRKKSVHFGRKENLKFKLQRRCTVKSRGLVAIAAGFALVLLAGVMMVQAEDIPKTVVLKGSPLGPVTMDHAMHISKKIPCETCHHASKPEKPMTAEHERCEDCHTKVAQAPMKTKLQAAFHDPMAKKGLCIDCHVKEAAAGVKTPAKCTDCHKRTTT